jgi:hypothetical protein
VKEKANPEVFFFYDKNIDLANTKKKKNRGFYQCHNQFQDGIINIPKPYEAK